MSFLDWLIPRSKSPNPLGDPIAPGLEPQRVQTASRPPVVDTDLKARRQERRERLYAVVRESMLRSEVLASRYKFKVLSLDTHGRQFLIMIDLMDASAVTPDRFASIEQLIIAHAAQQHGIYVKSVYWRGTESLVLPPVAAQPVHVSAPEESVPEVVLPVAIAPNIPVAPVAPVLPEKPTVQVPLPVLAKPLLKPAFDPIDQAEVLAFKKAIGAIPTTPVGKATGHVHTSGSRRVMTGFEDTQILDIPDDGVSPLSRTQFGELL